MTFNPKEEKEFDSQAKQKFTLKALLQKMFLKRKKTKKNPNLNKISMLSLK